MNYVISDIHNHNTALLQLLEKVKFNPAEDKLYMLGDLFDRGTEAIEIWNTYKELKKQGCVVGFIGNHDYWLAGSLKKFLENGIGNSYYETADIFKLYLDKNEIENVISEINGWEKQLEIKVGNTNYLLAHARTCDPKNITNTDFCYFSGAYVDDFDEYIVNGIDGYVSIVGHTPYIGYGKVVVNEKKNVYVIDAGIGIGTNNLACFCLDTKEIIDLTD